MNLPLGMERTLRLQPHFDSVLLLLTNRCNLSCRHCYVSSEPKGEWGLPVERILHLVDEIHDKLGSVCFMLSGGEALTRLNDAYRILNYTSRIHDVVLLSNGTLFSPAVARQLAAINISIRISLDGSTAESHDRMRGAGTFVRLLKGIENLIQAGFPVERISTSTTIVPETVHEMNQIVKLCEAIGIRNMKFEPVAKTGRAREYWPESPPGVQDPDSARYLDYSASVFPKQHSTWEVTEIDDRSFKTLTVYCNGDVYPYTWIDEHDRRAGLAGNISIQTLAEILEGERMTSAIIDKFLMAARVQVRNLKALRMEQPTST